MTEDVKTDDPKDGDLNPEPEKEQESPDESAKEKEFAPPKDGSWIPKVRFDEAVNNVKDDLQKEREARIRLEEQVKTLSVKPEPKKYSLSELNKLVDDGKVTREQADQYWEQQVSKSIDEKVDAKVSAKEQERERTAKLKTKIDRYKSLAPDVLKQGSEDRQKVINAYKDLVDAGHPDDARTELAALMAVYGTADELEKRKSSMTRELRDKHQETGGGKPPSDPTQAGLLKTLSVREKAHYESLIQRGLYKDWKDVEEELKYADPNLRKRYGAKV